MEYIGFSTKFYTLWEVSSEVRETPYDKYTITHHTYIKNISFDRDTAFAKYPDAKFDPSLRGHSSFSTSKHEIVDNGCFRCGKYFGTPILDCTNSSYLLWYYGACAIDIEKVLIEENLLKDSNYRKLGDSIVTFEQYESAMKEIEEVDNWLYEIEKNDGVITITPERNIDECCNLSIGKLWLNFEKLPLKDMEYNGYRYYLPEINGKGKKIKGKNLTIRVEVTENLTSDTGAALRVDVKEIINIY